MSSGPTPTQTHHSNIGKPTLEQPNSASIRDSCKIATPLALTAAQFGTGASSRLAGYGQSPQEHVRFDAKPGHQRMRTIDVRALPMMGSAVLSPRIKIIKDVEKNISFPKFLRNRGGRMPL